MSARHGGRGPMAMPVQSALSPYLHPSHTTGQGHQPTRVGPVSVQDQVLHTGKADCLLHVPDAHGDSPLVSTVVDPHILASSSELARLETAEWCNRSLNVEPWFPGSRIDPDLHLHPDFCRHPSLHSTVQSLDDDDDDDDDDNNNDDNFSAELLAHHHAHQNLSAIDPPASTPDHLCPSETPLAPVTVCDHCAKKFTGQYRRGNYARHVKQKHSGALKSMQSWICRVCKKTFKRQDARRKHEWRIHGLEDAKPSPRKFKAPQHAAQPPPPPPPSDAAMDEAISQQELPSSLATPPYASVPADHLLSGSSLQDGMMVEQDSHPDAAVGSAVESTILGDMENIAQWFLQTDHSQHVPPLRSSDDVVAEFHMRKGSINERHHARQLLDANANHLLVPLSSPHSVTSNRQRSSVGGFTQPSTERYDHDFNSFVPSSQTSWSFNDESSLVHRSDLSQSMMRPDPPLSSQSSLHPLPSHPTRMPWELSNASRQPNNVGLDFQRVCLGENAYPPVPMMRVEEAEDVAAGRQFFFHEGFD